MTKAEKFNLYADTLYGMCRKAQDTVPEALVCFECKIFNSKKLGTYHSICVGITTVDGIRKYYDVCEALRDMEESFESVKTILNNLLLNAPCPYCEKEEED
nr:MAG TPA: restriction alleviation protein [Caudoviricetes sp.]